jgi:hypothetical protein
LKLFFVVLAMNHFFVRDSATQRTRIGEDFLRLLEEADFWRLLEEADVAEAAVVVHLSIDQREIVSSAEGDIQSLI